MKVNSKFDVRSDIKENQDPDMYSKTLKAYHKFLWSKKLPNGQHLELSDSVSGKYLFHKSSLGEFTLSSDAISSSFINGKRMTPIIDLLDERQRKDIFDVLYTVGGFIIFPSNKVDNKMTINGARGLSSRVIDRFDITLECIRRHYQGMESPLGETFKRYTDFFSLFDSFQGYVEYFLLQDLVDPEFKRIQFSLPFDDSFPTRPFPADVDEYKIYISHFVNFVRARSLRMERYSQI